MAKTVADMLVERLIDWGVDTIFGYPGDGINGVFEALRTNQDKLKFIQVLHLRGFGRQMGGLYLIFFNWLEGPPAFAPALFTGFAAVGLIAIYFL